ncbi:hypothetical protein J8F10_37710 [Gemmata sp. G18]|uniref:DUF998 domain-containing protein n=1 Tax=Gemmata palustris TaxID=2822762 RepID=A0ABS5C515_9BACT|nr:hypothetical protein [Gemmata palustris]MBP3960993.1 hypothetical protein [Gemmata palustris]
MHPTTRERFVWLAFGLWAVGGVVWVLATGYVADLRWDYSAELTFQYVGHVPGPDTPYAKGVRLNALWELLSFGSIGYAAIGAFLFRRRGCVVFGAAVAIVVFSWLAPCTVGLGHL